MASRLEVIVSILMEEGVEFIIIGGQAELIFGSPRVTYDVDMCYRRTPQNIERLARALQRMKPTLRGAPPDLPFSPDATTIERGDNFTFSTMYGDLDLLGHVEPLGGFERLMENVERCHVAHHEVLVIGLDDLVRIKRHINRAKDRDSLFQLLAIKRLREEEGLR